MIKAGPARYRPPRRRNLTLPRSQRAGLDPSAWSRRSRQRRRRNEVETSLGLAYFPKLLDPAKADDGAAAPTAFEAINRGWVSITRPWHLVSKNTGLGDPSQATAEKGKRLMDVLVERLGTFLIELAKRPLGERFPY